MKLVTLPIIIYDRSQIEIIEKYLKTLLSGLRVTVETIGVTTQGWIRVKVSNEDEKVALRYLTKKIGINVARLEDLQTGTDIFGFVKNIDAEEIKIDIGISLPKNLDATIPSRNFQYQLSKRKENLGNKILELYGICEKLPLRIKILSARNEKIEAELSEIQVAQYQHWKEALLDRLIILGVPINDIQVALKQTKLDRYIVEIESLGFFENSVICRLGTDARGLIPRIGKKMKKARITVFSPQKIWRFFGDQIVY